MGKRNKTPDGADVGKVAPQSLLMTYSGITAAILIILAGIHAARSILGPFLMATFFTVLLISPINWLKKRGFSAGFSMTVVIIVVVICGLVCTTVIGGQVAQFAKNLPEYRDQFNDTLKSYDISIEEFLPPFLRSDDTKDEVEPAPEGEDPERTEESAGSETAPEPSSEPDSSPKEPTAPPSRAPRVEKLPSSTVAQDESQASEERRSHTATALVAYTEPVEQLDPDDGQEPKTMPEGDALDDSIALAVDGGKNETLGEVVTSFEKSILPDDPKSRLIMDDPPEFFADADKRAERANENLEDESDPANDTTYESERRLPAPPITAVGASSQSLFQFLSGLAGELSYFLSTAFIVMLLVVFMLIETANIPAKLVSVLGKRRFTNTHIDKVIDDIRNYMVIKTEMSLIIGVSVTILLMVTNVQYPILWGFVAFLLNYIPNIGSVVAAIPPIVLATVEHGVLIGCVNCVAFVALNCTVGYVLEPRLLGKGLGLSPLIVLMSLIFFGWLLGPVGMFLSPPLAVVMKIIFQAFPETRWVAALMANKPLPPSKRGERKEDASDDTFEEQKAEQN